MLVFCKDVNSSIPDLSDITFCNKMGGSRSYTLTGRSGCNLNSSYNLCQMMAYRVSMTYHILHAYLTVVKGSVSDLGTVPLNGLDSLEAVPISLPDALPASNLEIALYQLW